MGRAAPAVAPGDRPAWWLEEAPPDPPGEPLAGTVDADVAIVGGGYTGLWTALALKERRPALEVALVEAEFCGFGPSGRNGGFLESFWPALGRLRGRLGDEGALAVARASAGVFDAVRALPDDVWLREGGMLMVSASPAQDAAVEAAVRTAAALGVPEQAVPLTAEEVAARCRSPRFRAGVLFPAVATVQPARLVRALRRAALGRGVRIFERSRARDVRPGLVRTSGGSVRAGEVVLATNAWFTGRREARRRLTNFGSYVVLTEPLPQRLRELGWTGGEAIVDGRMFLHYFRTTEDGRVLMGSGSGPIGFGGRVDRRFTHDAATVGRAEAALARLLPGLGEARIEQAWGGPIDVSADHLPFFGSVPGGHVHYGAGYSGNGVGPSWLGGRILASLALGLEDEWSSLPLVTRRVPSFPPEPVRRLGGGLVRWGILGVEEADDRGVRPPPGARAIASLPRRFGLRVGTR
ncbi:MAG TPA: FAD-dependent oxidoreductase [Gaiellaceae bacterium]|nr:FAD-dependent oxidoreductase [Gaiellaceae bacterium]